MTNVESLKKLYAAMGGDPADVADLKVNAELIDALSDVAGGGGGGSSLPPVTSADNGDVLTVVDGAWNKAAPSGGGLVVNLSYDDATGVYTAGTKAGVIFSALEAGQYVRFQMDVGTQGYPRTANYLLVGYVLDAEAGYMLGINALGEDLITLLAATADDYPTSDK